MTAEQLLAGVVLRPTAGHLVPYANRFARPWPVRLHLVHIVSPIDHCSTVHMPGASITQMESVLRRRAHDRMAVFSRTWFDGGDGSKTADRFGDVAQELIRCIGAAPIAFVIMGTRARAGLNRFRHGSVSDPAARVCRGPVKLINVGATKGIGRLDRNEAAGATLPQASD